MSAFRQARIRHHLKLRAEILQAIRIYFCEHDYLEVETPLRIRNLYRKHISIRLRPKP